MPSASDGARAQHGAGGRPGGQATLGEIAQDLEDSRDPDYAARQARVERLRAIADGEVSPFLAAQDLAEEKPCGRITTAANVA